MPGSAEGGFVFGPPAGSKFSAFCVNLDCTQRVQIFLQFSDIVFRVATRGAALRFHLVLLNSQHTILSSPRSSQMSSI